ncbi:winged helix-turn-helix domain-containing protein [Catellatospora sp. NPDC049609]|uniref:winged helix-turn-helix domain-containing protein n=1 Tax=Catellatospora sp. NPDC049609 TaxID=3155505 RepID=UPI0034261713
MTTTLLPEPAYTDASLPAPIGHSAGLIPPAGDEPLTVTLTLKLTGPDAASAATRLVHALADAEPLRDTVWDGEIATPEPAPAPPVTATPVVIDTVSRTVDVDGSPVRFTRREFELLFFLVRHTGAAFTRLQLMRAVWGHEFSGERTVDVHVRRVRAKLGGHGAALSTVHGFGYRLEPGSGIGLRRAAAA